MRSVVQRGAIGAATAAAALAGLAGVANAETVKGVVVHHNRHAHSFVVAARTGRLFAIHASRAPRIGATVVVRAKRLRDGTYRLQRERSVTRGVRRVQIRGVVSWVNHRTGAFTISSQGVSMLVVRSHRRAAPAAGAMRSAVQSIAATPSFGTDVVATGTVNDQGQLEDQNVQDEGQDTRPIDLEGTVLSVDTAARTLTVSADDEDQSGGSIVVSVPATFDLTQFTPGEEVELSVQSTGAGTTTLLGSADDENAQSANDQGDSQGENPGLNDQGEQSGTDQGDQSGSDDQGDQSGSDDQGDQSSSDQGDQNN